MKNFVLTVLSISLSFGSVACAGGGRISLAPHLSRETELGPAAANGRFGVVMDRAAAFENQNLGSRDVHWYRAWRASAMLGLGQVDEAIALLDRALSDIASTPTAPAQADRLRVFIYDLRARGFLMKERPADALPDLDRSFSLASEVDLETNGDCDRALMLSARARQLQDVAAAAGDGARVETAKVALERQLERWQKCYAERDYPGMLVVETLAKSLSGQVIVAQAQAQPQPKPQQPVAIDPPAKKSEPVKHEPPPEKAKPVADVAQLPTVRAQYAPIDPLPWKSAIDSAIALGGKHASSLKGDIVIRTDGGHHALRLRANVPKYSAPVDLAPLFRATVVFFEQARSIEPKVDRVMIVVEAAGGTTQLLANRADVLELFQDRLDALAFSKKLVRVM
jgi:hypothetical protein